MSRRGFGEDLHAAALAEPDKQSVVTPEGVLTYDQLDRAADRVARGLVRLGVSRGDRVVLLLPNGLDAVVAIFGVLRAGGAISPLHPTVKEQKLAHVLRACGARVLITDAERSGTARAAAAIAGDVTVCDDVGALEGVSLPAPPLSIDLAAVIYTSGSTGEPKGVTLTHANMTFVADSMLEYLGTDQSDRVLCMLPLSFGYGLYQLLTCVRTRATLVLEPGFSLPGRVVQLLAEQRITVLPGVPTMFQILVARRGPKSTGLSDLRVLTSAGAALPPSTIAALRETYPDVKLYVMYGQTECQRVCYLPPEQVDKRPSSVGIAIPGTEAWVEGEGGVVASPGEIGQLMVRGAHVMQGYWGDPETTATRLRQGRWPWERVLATGDLFRTDEDGYLYFVGRQDDIIKSRGQKVVPREVEDVLLEVEGVTGATVLGVEDPLLGVVVHAHVSVPSRGELREAELRRHCAERLEDHMVPKRIFIHEEIPRTLNGKVDRLALIALATGTS
jgi:long-chain acyl-CoA synthetase